MGLFNKLGFFASQSTDLEFIVTSDADSGPGSLRQTIVNAPDGASISFNIVGSDIITLTDGQLIVNKSLSYIGINVATLNPITIKVTTPGSSGWRLFQIGAGVTSTTFNNLKFQGGNVANGAAIYSESGDVNFVNCEVENGVGSQVYIAGGGGNLSLQGTTIQNCTGSSPGCGIHMLASSKTITLEDSTINNCNSGGATGGAIYINASSCTLKLLRSTLSNNTAFRGASIYASGASHKYLFINSTLTGGTVTGTYGSAIYTESTGSEQYILNCTLYNNSHVACYFGYGNVYLVNSIIIKSGTTDLQFASAIGYAYYSWYNNTSGTLNTQPGSPNSPVTWILGMLGDLDYYQGGLTKTIPYTATTSDSVTTGGNWIYDTNGTYDGLYFKTAEAVNPWRRVNNYTIGSASEPAGKIETDQSGQTRTGIGMGSEEYEAIAVVTTNADSGGGSLRYMIDNATVPTRITFNIPGNDVITLLSEIAVNTSITMEGINIATSNKIQVKVTTPGTSTYRLFNVSGSPVVEINDMILKGGRVSDGSIISWKDTSLLTINRCDFSDATGRALYHPSATLNKTSTFIDCTFQNITNDMAGYGSAISLEGVISIVMDRCLFDNCHTNSPGLAGGAFGTSGAVGNDILIENTSFTNCSTTGAGGGFYIRGWQRYIIFNNITIANNSAPTNGGGAYIECIATNLLVINSTVSGNTGTNTAGATFYIGGGNKIHLVNSVFVNNTGTYNLNIPNPVEVMYCWYHSSLLTPLTTHPGTPNDTTTYTAGMLGLVGYYDGASTKTVPLSSGSPSPVRTAGNFIYNTDDTVSGYYVKTSEATNPWRKIIAYATGLPTEPSGKIETDQSGQVRTGIAMGAEDGVLTSPPLSGLVSQYDASNSNSFVMSSDRVTEFKDVVGANNLTQSTYNIMPSITNNEVNGKNVLTFPTSRNAYLLNNTPSLPSGSAPRSIYAVIKPISQVGVVLEHIWHYGNGVSNETYGLAFHNTGKWCNHYWVGIWDSTFNWTTLASLFLNEYSGTVDYMYKGSSLVSGGSNTVTLNTGSANLKVGSRGPIVGEYAYFHLCELIIYNRILTAGEKTEITNYLVAKWGSI